MCRWIRKWPIIILCTFWSKKIEVDCLIFWFPYFEILAKGVNWDFSMMLFFEMQEYSWKTRISLAALAVKVDIIVAFM